ncbi:MAG: penicillin-binding protein 1C [Alphaproteobacteria bacterium]
MQRRVTYPKWLSYNLAILVAVFVAAVLIFPVPVGAARHVSPIVKDQNGRWMTGFTVEDGTWRIRADLTEIDQRFIERVIRIEDKRFWHHSGVDIPAIFRAGRSWTQAGKPVSGASTITMQLVRQLELRPRTMGSKIIETFRAMQYELRFSKAEILELYLTHISYGGNIEGVHAASQVYFGKPPFQLTDSEIALLIALPQAPEARRPDLHAKAAMSGRDDILEKLGAAGMLTPLQVSESKELSFNIVRQAMPERAWITARGLITNEERAKKGQSSGNDPVASTLDYDLQVEIEALTAEFVAPLDAPVNTAVTIVDNRTMSVRAHIASADRARPGGWIDMSDRARSPGSTLKPFIYGLAMDDGLLSAGSFIRDAPTRFGSYQPENFDRRYYGDVRIYEALRHSLNVPAVAVLDRVGGARLETTLTAAGVDITRLGGDSENAGLALALGGAGLTVNDLAVLYAALANGGDARTLRWREGDEPKTYRLLSEETSAEITRILRQAPTPQGRVPAWLAKNAPPIAYKTGTSYGFRDAWAAGYTDDWTVIVWVGRPDGGPRRGETGRIAAAPLLFDVFSRLPHTGDAPSYKRDADAPAGLTRVDRIDTGPQILFPPDGAELLATKLGANGRGFALTARTQSGMATFYVDGEPVALEHGKTVWRPNTSGFYEVAAIDESGQRTAVRVEVLSMADLAFR